MTRGLEVVVYLAIGLVAMVAWAAVIGKPIADDESGSANAFPMVLVVLWVPIAIACLLVAVGYGLRWIYNRAARET